MTITEKIIAAHAGTGAVAPGDFVYADVDIELEIPRKQWHDIIGHYNRFDVLSLNLNKDADQPVRFLTNRPSASDAEAAASDAIARLLEQIQADQHELRKAVDILAQQLGQQQA